MRVELQPISHVPPLGDPLRPAVKSARMLFYAVDADNITSTDKGTLVRHLAKKGAERAVVYVGDGSSDFPALDAHELVACYFGLKDSKFADELAERGLTHFTYETSHDIRLKLEQLSLMNEAKHTI